MIKEKYSINFIFDEKAEDNYSGRRPTGRYYFKPCFAEIYPENIIPRISSLFKNEEFLFEYDQAKSKFEWFLHEIITTDLHEFLHHFIYINRNGALGNFKMADIIASINRISIDEERWQKFQELRKQMWRKHEDEIRVLEICIFQFLLKNTKPTKNQITFFKTLLFKSTNN